MQHSSCLLGLPTSVLMLTDWPFLLCSICLCPVYHNLCFLSSVCVRSISTFLKHAWRNFDAKLSQTGMRLREDKGSKMCIIHNIERFDEGYHPLLTVISSQSFILCVLGSTCCHGKRSCNVNITAFVLFLWATLKKSLCYIILHGGFKCQWLIFFKIM